MVYLYVCPECGFWTVVYAFIDAFIQSSATATHLCPECKCELYQVVGSDRLQVTSEDENIIEQP